MFNKRKKGEKMKKSLSVLAAAVIFGFVGCGGGGGSSSSSTSFAATSTGTFVDAPVAGLSYQTSSGLTGVTDNQGHFKYRDLDEVTFKVGNVTIGKTIAHGVVTPYELTSNYDYLAYLLQNLDSDGNLSNGIQIPKDLPDVNIDLNDLNSIQNALNTIKTKLAGKYKFPDISIDEAKNNLSKSTQNIAFYKVDDIINKVWYGANPNDPAHPLYDVLVDLKDGIVKYRDHGNTEWSYDQGDKIEKVNDYVLKETDGEGNVKYMKFYKIDNGFIRMVSNNIDGNYTNSQEYYFNDFTQAQNLLNKFLVPISEIQNKVFYIVRLAPVLNIPMEELYAKFTSDSFISAFDKDFKDGYDKNDLKKYNDYVLQIKGCDEQTPCLVDVWFKRNGDVYMIEDDKIEDVSDSPIIRFGVYGDYDKVKTYINSIMPKNAELVTSFSQIDGRWFYNLQDENDHFGTKGLYVENNKYDVYVSDNLTTDPTNLDDSGSVTLRSDGRFAFDDDINFIYKVPLNGYSFTAEELEYLMEENYQNVFKSLGISTLTFHNGYIYCSMYDSHCWIDKDAMEDVISQFGQ